MKKLLSIFLSAALLASLTACEKPLTNTDAAADTANTDSTAAAQTAGTTSYDTADAVVLTFTDSGITASSEAAGYSIDGTALTLEKSGTYILTGSCQNGSVRVKKGTTGVTLVLRDLTLTSTDTAPITCAKSSEVTILVEDDTQTTLTDAAENNKDTCPDNANAENAVLKCKDGSQVTLCGGGTLNIVANGKNGIKSGAATAGEGAASLTIRELTLNITALVNDAINAEQTLNLESGTLNIAAGDDAVHSDYVLVVGAENTDGPTINISQCCEGLEGAELTVASGSIHMQASDDCLNVANGDLRNYDFTCTITGGTLILQTSGGDGIDSNGDLTITGGTVVVWTANSTDNQPLDADGTITITGGTVLAAGGSAGMGITLSAAQPCVQFGSTSGMMTGGMGGPGADDQTPPELPDNADGTQVPPQRPDSSEADQPAADGQTPPTPPDGTDTSQSRPEKPDNMPDFSGKTPSFDGSAPDLGSFPGTGDAILAAGDSFTITDADGSVVYTGEAVYDARFLFFSSADLTADASYTLQSDTGAAETAQAVTGDSSNDRFTRPAASTNTAA